MLKISPIWRKFHQKKESVAFTKFFWKKKSNARSAKIRAFSSIWRKFHQNKESVAFTKFFKKQYSYNSVIFSLYLWSDNALFYVQFMKKIIKQFSSHEIFLWFFRKDFCPMGKSLASLNFSHSLFSKFIKKYYCTIIGLWGCTALGTIFLPADFAIPCPVSIVLITSLSLILGM